MRAVHALVHRLGRFLLVGAGIMLLCYWPWRPVRTSVGFCYVRQRITHLDVGPILYDTINLPVRSVGLAPSVLVRVHPRNYRLRRDLLCRIWL